MDFIFEKFLKIKYDENHNTCENSKNININFNGNNNLLKKSDNYYNENTNNHQKSCAMKINNELDSISMMPLSYQSDDSCFYESSIPLTSVEDSSSSSASSISNYASISASSSISLDSCSSSNSIEFKSSSVKSECQRELIETESFFKSMVQSQSENSSNPSIDSLNGNIYTHQFITNLCAEIDAKHQHLNAHISSLVSNCGDLKLNAKFWTYLLSKLGLISLLNDLDENSTGNYLLKRQEFMKSFFNLLMCINKLEKGLAIFLKSDETSEFLFDSEFFLSLAFLIFEKVTHLTTENETNLYADNIELVFELDLNNSYDSSIWLFELNLNSLLENYVFKFLPDLIELQKVLSVNPLESSFGSGKSSLEFFKNLFKKEDFTVKNIQNFDIDLLISKPCVANPDDFLQANPITQSYKCLLNNLNALKFCSYDPFGEADEKAAEFGREVNNVSFGCLSFSYLSMGYFEIRMLLENSFQFLYEIQQFNNELKSLFRFNIENEHKKISNKYNQCDNRSSENANLKSISKNNLQSKWNMVGSKSELEKENHKDNILKRNNSSVLDDIIHRISSLSIPINFESYFKFSKNYFEKDIKNNDSIKSPPNNSLKKQLFKEEDLPNTRNNWTVAPKLFVSNNNACLSPPSTNRFGMNAQNCTVFSFEKSTKYTLDSLEKFNDFYETSQNSWPKPDPRPIGTKPASMSTTSNCSSSRNRYYKNINSKHCSNQNTKLQNSPKFFLENCKNIWIENEIENETKFSFKNNEIDFKANKNSIAVNQFQHKNINEFTKCTLKNNKLYHINDYNPEIDMKSSFSNNFDINKNNRIPESDICKNEIRFIKNKTSSIEIKSGKYSVAPNSLLQSLKSKRLSPMTPCNNYESVSSNYELINNRGYSAISNNFDCSFESQNINNYKSKAFISFNSDKNSNSYLKSNNSSNFKPHINNNHNPYSNGHAHTVSNMIRVNSHVTNKPIEKHENDSYGKKFNDKHTITNGRFSHYHSGDEYRSSKSNKKL